MANIVRWDPIREMISMRDAMDQVFDDFFNRNPSNLESFGVININMLQTDDAVIIEAFIPGVRSEDLNISITGDTLTIRGEIKDDEEYKNANYKINEIKFGSFARSILLTSQVVIDKANSEYQDGVLKITLPNAEEIKPKIIAINAK